MTKRVFIAGHYGFGNTGDEAILGSTVGHLREIRPNLQITVATATPESTATALGVKAVLWSDAHAVFESVREADLVLVGGGGIFHDYAGINPSTFLTDNHSGISYFTGPAMMAALCEKPVMLYAVGVGPLFSEPARQFTLAACATAAAITVRDEASKQLLESLGVAADRVTLTGDPAFGFARPQDRTASADAAVPRPRVAVALRRWDVGTPSGSLAGSWEREVAAGLDNFLAHYGGSVVFIPFERPPKAAAEDLAVARRVHSYMQQPDAASVCEADLSLGQMLSQLSGFDLVVGMRMHSLVLGMVAGVPVLALSYDAKVEQVMRRTGWQDLTLDIRSLNAGTLATGMKRALDAKRRVAIEELAAAARENAAIAVSILDRGESASVLNPAVASVLRHGIQAQLREAHALHGETRRLFKELEFYAEKIAGLETQQAEATARDEASRIERTQLLARTDKLAQDNQRLQEQTVFLERSVLDLRAAFEANLAANAAAHQEELRVLQASTEDELRRRTVLQRTTSDRLRQGEELRRQMVARLNQFQNKLTTDVERYRDQRAWKVMLAIRKGYTLRMRRGFGAFLRWAFALPFAGPGPLQEYELAFPDVRNYLPERLDAPHDPLQTQTDEPHELADLIPVRKYDVIILAIFDFDFRFQRPQQMAAQFARTGHRVFWVSPARFLDSSAEEPYEAISLRENLWEVRLRGDRPDLYGGQPIAGETDSYAASLKCLYRDFQISESCALLQFPYWRELALALREESGSRLIYDCMDDWQNWTAEPRIGDFSLAEERKLARDCDVLVVSSQEFRARYQAPGLSPVLLRNAADFEFFASTRENGLLADIPGPIIGYYGAIANWFDLDLMAAVAAARPKYSFVLIGQVHEVDTSRLSALPNVYLLGEKHYREIPQFLTRFDVCLIPFQLTPLTKGVDPVKLYEYLSQGKPVVATDLAELPRDLDLLYTGTDAADFSQKIDLALVDKDDGRKRELRVEYARSNTWANRVDELDQAISAHFALVSILIVTHNCKEFMPPCLDAVARNTSWPRYEVIIVDNNSQDGTKQILEDYARADGRIRFIPQSENLGFAAANNIAAEVARGEYIVFLNPDTIVTPGWLGRMIRHCESDPAIGAVAAVTNFSGNETKLNVDYGNVMEMLTFALDLSANKQNQSTTIDVAPLYCVVVPRTVWSEVGELDAGFQVGMFEDDDFSLRILKAGYRIVAAEDCFVHHFGNGSFAKLPPEDSVRIFEQNRQRFEKKWGIVWQPHKLRPGVRSPSEEPRFSPSEFLQAGREAALRTREPLIVNRLHPPQTIAGKNFNAQPDGTSALVIECMNATPNTVIVMGSTILRTSYGKESLLSGLVPPELYEQPGTRQVYLLNDFGESNTMEFEVLASAGHHGT